MKFEKGKSGNINGRPKGIKNKINRLAKEEVEDIFTSGIAKYKTELLKLEGLSYVREFKELFDYLIPKAKEQETQSNNIDLTNAFKQAINATY